MKKMSRRQFLKGMFGALAAGALTAGGGYGYARYLEPHMIETTEHTIKSSLIPHGFDGFKIVQFSDAHLSDYFTLEDLQTVILTINESKPDLIVFTGDIIDNPDTYQHHQAVIPLLRKLNAPFGKLCIYGNHDHGGYGTAVYKSLMTAGGFTVYRNGYQTLSLADGSKIEIASLDDLMLGNPDYEGTLSRLSDRLFSILLVHEPDAALKTTDYPVNLQLSGHTHGGQIQLPFYGPIITPPYGKVYTEGMYQTGSTHIYVNRGLGMTRLPLRFLAKPEITVFTLKSTN
ncbi:metallophosphoesterase [Bacillus subtilis]|uniref:metallophosphoesterase n=1 Tax=Bacillus subtilis TaxID=1423 RepID=UPI0002C4F86B|nr:metallophosphoesterase [Bacillus subtilis]AGI28701.1 metallophosphoesterase YkuE [Bacillus subtilis subsp. subtilis str. BAB-1]AKD34810.1 metallophosphoesterase [Bacillus subtilis HJ5]ALS82422.1 metallophosphoesterase [Bacillus subtilis subsp. subtilis]AOS67635.1 metallophosphoesterase [Bacillus subtilis]ARW31209.1 putative metallophosphoesterase YkuE [Bacillus subtilis subsp. subtilis]